MRIIIDWPEDAPLPTAVEITHDKRFASPNEVARRAHIFKTLYPNPRIPLREIAARIGVSTGVIKDYVRKYVPPDQRRAIGNYRGRNPFTAHLPNEDDGF